MVSFLFQYKLIRKA